jgi:hypothetical protein
MADGAQIEASSNSAVHAIHSPQAKQAAHVASEIGKEATSDERGEINAAIKAGQHHDVDGVIRHSMPVAKEAAKIAVAPHLVVMQKAKELALKHGEAAARDESSKESPAVRKMLNNVHIDHTTENQRPSDNQKR